MAVKKPIETKIEKTFVELNKVVESNKVAETVNLQGEEKVITVVDKSAEKLPTEKVEEVVAEKVEEVAAEKVEETPAEKEVVAAPVEKEIEMPEVEEPVSKLQELLGDSVFQTDEDALEGDEDGGQEPEVIDGEEQNTKTFDLTSTLEEEVQVEEDADFVTKIKKILKETGNYGYLSCGRHLRAEITRGNIKKFYEEFISYGASSKNDSDFLALCKKEFAIVVEVKE